MKNLEALEQKHKELGEEIERLKRQGESVVWKPEVGEDYWVVDYDGRIVECANIEQTITDKSLEIGNCFPTREAAQRHRDKLILLQELREFANFKPDWGDDELKYFLQYYNEGKGWRIAAYWSIQRPNTIHFPTETRAQEAIEHFGKRLDLLLD